MFTVWNLEKENNIAKNEESSNIDGDLSLSSSSLQRKSTNFDDYYDQLATENYDYGDYFFKNFER